MTALVTPFKNGEIDWEALAGLVEFQLANGADALVPCGSTGESATLGHDEHREVVRFVVERTRGRVPVIAGTGSNSTLEAIRLTREAKEAGASGALLISPYYNKPTQEGLYQHYSRVASEVDLPQILYNIPGRTACRIEIPTFERLAKIPNIVGVKEATGSMDFIVDLFSALGDRLAVYSGDDALTFSIMALGGKGAISAVANVAPARMSALVKACEAGNWEEGRKLQLALVPLIRACFMTTNPIAVKAALSLMRKCSEELRLPLVGLSDAERRALRDRLSAEGLLGG